MASNTKHSIKVSFYHYSFIHLINFAHMVILHQDYVLGPDDM